MKKYKLCIGIDGNGHFMISDFNDRKATFGLLKKLEDGDTLTNALHDLQSPPFFEDNIQSIGDAKYLELVYCCAGRGLMEVLEVNL